MIDSFVPVTRSALIENSNGTLDTCDALFHEENIRILSYLGITSRPVAITEKGLGIELDSTALEFKYAQSSN